MAYDASDDLYDAVSALANERGWSNRKTSLWLIKYALRAMQSRGGKKADE